MAGCARNLAAVWKLIRENGIDLDEPIRFGHYLGCGQHRITITREEVSRRMQHILPLFNAIVTRDDIQFGELRADHVLCAISKMLMILMPLTWLQLPLSLAVTAILLVPKR